MTYYYLLTPRKTGDLDQDEWKRLLNWISSDAKTILGDRCDYYYWRGLAWPKGYYPGVQDHDQSEILMSHKTVDVVQNDSRKKKIIKLSPNPFLRDCIRNLCILDGVILNPPPYVVHIDLMKHITLPHNQLMILDALFEQGSNSKYQQLAKGYSKSNPKKYIYSEHSGSMIVKNDEIDQILVYAAPGRIEETDAEIIMPINQDDMGNHPYLFHTHPGTSRKTTLIREGVVFEFPSPGDLFNFAYYEKKQHKVQASIIVVAEGMYVIRKNNWDCDILLGSNEYPYIQKGIDKIHRLAQNNIGKNPKCYDSIDNFQKYVARNPKYIEKYNKLLHHTNLFVDYYPRIYENNEWTLMPIQLLYQEPTF